jgi:hypothetical protein
MEPHMADANISEKPARWPIVVAILILLIFWISNLFYGLHLDENQRGTFGDMFGAVNAIFSGMAFVGVIYAITMQRREIEIARQDI